MQGAVVPLILKDAGARRGRKRTTSSGFVTLNLRGVTVDDITCIMDGADLKRYAIRPGDLSGAATTAQFKGFCSVRRTNWSY